jgi:hypothetical protein
MTASTFAQSGSYEGSETRIDTRQERQQERIQRGIDTGRLTESEAKKLLGAQRNIQRAERKFRADGVVTDDERTRLRVALDKEDARIRSALRDDDRTSDFQNQPRYGEREYVRP